MSGIEVAGLILGSFPIILNCLDYYREGFEPLEEWWCFRTHFIAFVDDINHQMMRYNGNMTRLLDPIVVDNESLTTLVRDAKDPRWTDGSLAPLLKQRLASELGRFLRIIQRMEEEIRGLKRLLGIKDGNLLVQVDWTQSEQQRPWDWHMKRFQISFSKGKTKKVRKLATHNQELEEILGYSERIMPIANKRKYSDPVTLFEKMCQHACAMHNALVRNWKCSGRPCRKHQANLCLQAEIQTVGFDVLFIIEYEQGSLPGYRKQEVTIQPVKENAAPPSPTEHIHFVRQAESFTAMQEQFTEMTLTKQSLRFKKIFSKAPNSSQPVMLPGDAKVPTKPRKQAHFATHTSAITIGQDQADSLEVIPSASSSVPSYRITDICSSLEDGISHNLGIMIDDFDRQFQVLKHNMSSPATLAPETARLTPLPKILDAHHQASIDIARHRRFEMAVQIVSALLQIHSSPWLSTRWSKDQLLFLADAQSIYSDHPYVSQTFMPNVTDSPTTHQSSISPPSTAEEDTRASLFTLGVIILELIFGHNIEACSFRHIYYGSDNQPNDQTDFSTARKWSQKVLGECGPDIADAVRRCLDCSFGPRPNLKDKRFREAVYDGVIRPLADRLKIWHVTVPQ